MHRIVTALLLIAGACAAAEGQAPATDLLGDKPPPQQQPQGPPEGARLRPDELFKTADANGDGKVSKEELAAALDKQRKAGREKQFEAMDTNKDGSISREEFLAFEPPPPPGMGQRPGQQRSQGPSAEMLMKRFDLNGDGFITEDEIRQVREQHQQERGKGEGQGQGQGQGGGQRRPEGPPPPGR